MTKRYEIHAVSNAMCTGVNDEILDSTEELAKAKVLAARHSDNPYGAAILDTASGLLDLGYGFGVAVPDPSTETETEAER